MIQGAIFDMDGTLLDSMPVWNNVLGRYLCSIDINPDPDLDKTVFNMTMMEAAAYVRQRYSMRQTCEEIVEGVNRRVFAEYAGCVPLKDSVLMFLQELHAKGIPMAVATSSDRVLADAALSRLKVMGYFQEILTGDEFAEGKKTPDIYLEAARRLNSRPETTWVFEDALYAAQTAKNAGFQIAAVFDEESLAVQEKLMELADAYIKTGTDWDQLLRSLLRETIE